MTSREIRQAFLDFFKSKGHQIVPSAPVVVKNDPTLMFTNAGMNQFKDLFLGEAPIKFPRVADTQRCLRVSGKHNDLEEVGIDTYHHTLFEMLGNWSFGDYFKKEAIAWAWELLTEVYKLDKDRLYVTIFEGDATEGLERDREAFDFWKQWIAEDRILLGNKKDNFWEMGETGPCGPCSEIHFDMRSESERAAVSGQSLVNADHPQVIEIWNLVFMQFNRLKDGSLQSLPAKHVDTGMGFERLVRCIQGKTSNYDTDVFTPTIEFISQKAGVKYGDDEKTDIAMRVVSDHIRAVSFAIADGQLPSNNKAGYVIRRILRRAVRYAYTFLGFKNPFIHELVPVLAAQFAGVFDELIQQQDFVQKVILEEEVSFLRTLSTGVQRFENYVEDHDVIDGDFAFELYDTYGFPIDLTELLAREKGLLVDMDGFNKALQIQKDRSRAATAIDTGDWVVVNEDEGFEFVGYDTLTATTEIVKYRKVVIKNKEQYQLVLSVSPFYAEGGGQVGDSGELVSEETGEKIYITDTKKENGLFVHFANKLPLELKGTFVAQVDKNKRLDTENNHSATHLLHAALKQVLGSHVNQKGSLVNADILRFDISHFAKMTDEEIKQVEDIVNARIRENIPLKEERNVPYQQALDSGVTALFGEKYGDFVRVITFDDRFSKELCGGTHVKATGQIGFFKIVGESAVAAGVRRIEAITGTKSAAVIREHFELVQHLKELLNNPKDFVAALGKVLDENGALKKEIEKSITEKSLALKSDLEAKIQQVGDINFLATIVDLPNAEAVKTLAYAIKGGVDNLFLVIGAEFDGKPSLTVVISDELAKEKGLNAGHIVRDLAKDIQGGGGGQPFYATAGGKHAAGLKIAIERAKEFI
ncbi:alanine--tRNA ligase [Sphingobacterium sp. InxBP1]|uniref:alanine--tRNA ligase n=1 Tax=Sphingobacterium sp. InxBP1 TaxID=2870328 RepID=UPI0022449018|nr:alanine--tRNA ligase [Sphingobacterium sp. InxBP1]MCW8310014.1 alanine--tRNA ligase [Sphingobacterium sp. InxBP1]